MKTLLLAMALVLLTGCVSITYDVTKDQTEHLEVKTLFKSLDGLWSERDADGFSIIIDKTYTHDPMRGIMELMETYEQLYGLGIRYDPVAQPLPFTED